MILYDLREGETTRLGEVIYVEEGSGFLNNDRFLQIISSLGYQLVLDEDDRKHLLKALKEK